MRPLTWRVIYLLVAAPRSAADCISTSLGRGLSFKLPSVSGTEDLEPFLRGGSRAAVPAFDLL